MDWREHVTFRRRLWIELRVLYNRTIGRAQLAVGRFFYQPLRRVGILQRIENARRDYMRWVRTGKG